MSESKFHFPPLALHVQRLNARRAGALTSPRSIADIERDAKFIQLNSRLQLYHVAIAGALAGGVLVASVGWIWLNGRGEVVRRAPVPAARGAHAVARTFSTASTASRSASGPAGGVFAQPVLVSAPPASARAPSASAPALTPIAAASAVPRWATQPGLDGPIRTLRLPMPGSVAEMLRTQTSGVRPASVKAPARAAPHKTRAPREPVEAVPAPAPMSHAAILYQAPAAPRWEPPSAAPTSPAPEPTAGPTMSIAAVPTAGVVLLEFSTPDGRLVRPYRVGQTLPDGEVLLSADPVAGRIVTNRRTISFKH